MANAVTRVLSTGGSDHTDNADNFDWLEAHLISRGAPCVEINGFLLLGNAHALKTYALDKGYLTLKQVEAAKQLQRNLSEISLLVSEELGESLSLTIRMEGTETRIDVRSLDPVGRTVAVALRLSASQALDCFLGEDLLDPESSFDDNGVDDGARLSVGPILDLNKIMDDICVLNKWLSKGALLKNHRRGYDNGDLMQLNEDGTLHSWDLQANPDPNPDPNPDLESLTLTLRSWDLQELRIQELPDSFCRIRSTGDLTLSGNQLGQGRGLPEHFGAVQVGGTLELSNNDLRSLPESFGGIHVGGEPIEPQFNPNLTPIQPQFDPNSTTISPQFNPN